MQVTSSDFQDMEPLPERFSRDGENINPSLTFSEIPPEAESLVLIVDDPDAPVGTFTHWILYNMSPGTLQIVEGELPATGIQGFSDYGEDSYGGPKPPSGTHRYFFRLFALDKMLEFEEGTKVDRVAIDEAMEGHIIEEAEIIGTYSA
jgi:Raf kinase inhibitor-like YbhB/YbcL family protein